MGREPKLPDDFEIPSTINGWEYDPEGSHNGVTFVSADGTYSAVACNTMDSLYATVYDERCDAREKVVKPRDIEIPDGADYELTDQIVREENASIVEDTIAWMESTAPDEYDNARVNERVFDPPVGYELECYYLEGRKTEIYYKRVGAETDSRRGLLSPEEYDLDNCPYLYIHLWNGSGNATIALAPWTRAHGPGSKYHEFRPVVEPPEECGLDVALSMAREWVEEHVHDGDGTVADEADQTGSAPLSGANP